MRYAMTLRQFRAADDAVPFVITHQGKDQCPACGAVHYGHCPGSFNPSWESRVDSLIGLVGGVIEHRRAHECYGLTMTDDQRAELTRAIVQALAADFDIMTLRRNT